MPSRVIPLGPLQDAVLRCGILKCTVLRINPSQPVFDNPCCDHQGLAKDSFDLVSSFVAVPRVRFYFRRVPKIAKSDY